MPSADTDRNLLFGVLALQADLIDAARFAEACSAWAGRKETPLADLLVERGWLTPADRDDVRRLLERKLDKHAGDAHASLAAAAAAGAQARQFLSTLGDPDVRHSVADLTPGPGPDGPLTVAYQPEQRGRYRLTQLHARGGIGQVWLARDTELGRDVALKELHPERADTPFTADRFLEEAQITGQLEHPGIVPVYELARHAGGRALFYTMRFVRGRTLSDAIRAYHHKRRAGRARPLDLRELLTAFVAVCNTVAYAHARGIVHRDLKGGNVVLGDFGEVIVLDWGLAKVLGRPEGPAPPVVVDTGAAREETLQGQVLGTPAYMSPEQAAGRHDRVGPASDVYSLGAILYEILTGQPPFTGGSTLDVLRRVIDEAPARPRSLVASAPAALEAVCLRALAKEPGGRYPTAAALADEVRHWQADEPVAACREPLPTRLARWGRRHRPLVAAAAALLLATVAALSVGTYLLGRANVQVERQREQARVQRDLARANFRKARQAVDDYFTKVSENKLLQAPLPGLQPLRKELLQLALAYYQTFVGEHQDDPEVRKDLGAAYLRLGLITAETESVEKALGLDEKGLNLLEELAREAPGDAGTQRLLGNGRTQFGGHLRRAGRDRAALASLSRAVATHEGRLHAAPHDSEASRDLALALNALGGFHSSRLHSADALAAYQRAADILQKQGPGPHDHERLRTLSQVYTNVGVEYVHHTGPSVKAIPVLKNALAIQERVAKQGPPDPENQRILSLIHNTLGLAFANNRRDAEARHHFDEMIAVGEKLARENPTVAGYWAALAESYRIVGRYHRRHRRPREALEALQSAASIMERLAREHGRNTDYQKTLALVHNSLGVLYMETGRVDEAERSFRRGIEVLGPPAGANAPDNIGLYYEGLIYANLGALQRRRGRHPEAARAYEKTGEIFSGLLRDNPKAHLALDGAALGALGLAEVRLTQGQVAEAGPLLRQAREQLDKVSEHKAYLLWRRAALHAQLGRLAGFGKTSPTAGEEKERRQQLDQAMSCLRQALAAGYDEPEELKGDPLLDPLRGRPDFRKLLAEQEARRP